MRYLIIFFVFNIIFGCKTSEISRQNIKSSIHIAEIQKSMRNKGVTDYFIVEHIQYGLITLVKKGYSKEKVCLPNGTYYSLYVFWSKNESNYIQKLDNCGGFEPIITNNLNPIEFYKKNSRDIINSKVVQYQTGYDSYSNLTHQPLRYFWFVKQNENFTTDFDTFDLTTDEDEPNLNYVKNNQQPIVKLNDISENLIDLLNKKKKFIRE